MTVPEYLTQRRVSCVQRLLATTDMKILDIAHASGFNSPGRFYACFRRLTGKSPARYRRSLRGLRSPGRPGRAFRRGADAGGNPA